MKAALYEAFGQPIKIQTVPDPIPSDDGVVIQVKANGICRSDWHGWMGHDSDVKLPHVPGHEMAGVVEAIGNKVIRWQVGDRVTLPFSCGCGTCEQCASGNQHICDNYFQPGFTAWGSFAEYVAIQHADVNLVKLPKSMNFVDAASLGCRFITSYRAVVHQSKLKPGEWVVIHGCGGIGLSALLIAKSMGAQVIGIDIKDEALKFADSLGANTTINASTNPRIIDTIKDITNGGAHVSIDALGSNDTCRNSIYSLRKRGRHIQIGVMASTHKETPIPMGMVMFNELELLGSHGMQAHAYKPMIEMISSGKLQPSKLINKTVSLEDSLEILETMGVSSPTGVVIIDRF